jgi:anti-sigma factor RsiW
MTIDDYTLAAFISGELPEARRSTVAAALVQDRDAREVLHMACEALAAAMSFQSGRGYLEEHATRRPARPGRIRADRGTMRMGRI